LSFAMTYGERLAGVHTIAGFAFVAAVALHLVHNGTSWLRYVRASRLRPSAPFAISVAIVGALITASVVRAHPVGALLAWGASLPSAGAPKRTTYDTISLDRGGAGPLLTLDVKAGPSFSFVEPEHGFHITPQLAVWTEDDAGRFLETLYVSRDEARAGYDEG